MIELLHIDCMEYMKDIPDKHFDLAIVDPPYGIGEITKVGDPNFYTKRSYKKYGKINWNNKIPTKEYFEELYRISKDLIIWGANYYWEYIPDKNFIVWYKKNKFSRWSKCEIASTSIGVNEYIELLWNGFLKCEKQNRIHPTQKPIQLYRWLLQKYAKQGDKIFDSHLGSGSIAIACDMEGFDLVGCEIDKEYYDAAVKRFNIYKAQKVLF